MTDSPDESDRESSEPPDASEAPFPNNLFYVMLVLAVVVPPVGMLIGAFNMDKPLRRKQSQLLLGIGLAAIIVIILFRS